MTRLDPELQRLFRWARGATAAGAESLAPVPAARVMARWRDTLVDDEPGWWRRLQVITAGASLLLLLTGIGVWIGQPPESPVARDLFPLFQMAARNLAP